MDLSTIEQKLDDSKYKTLNEVRMFTFIKKKNCGMAAVKDTSYFHGCPSGKKMYIVCTPVLRNLCQTIILAIFFYYDTPGAC